MGLFITTLMDSKLQAALLTDKTVTMATPIKSTGKELSVLTWIEEYLLRHTPLFVRRYEYAICHQLPNESFEDWWTRKLIRARNCDLAEITEETYQITELICGINNQKMRDEMLKIKDPTLERLVILGKSYDTSAHIQKVTFGKEANANKVQSGYKREKVNANRNRAKDNSSQQNNPPSSSERCKTCGGTPCFYIHPDTKRYPNRKPAKYCLAKDKTCLICKKKRPHKVRLYRENQD